MRLFHEALAEAVRVLAARERLEQQGIEETAQSVGAEIERAALRFLDTMLAMLPAADAPAAAYQHLAPYLFEQLPAHLADAGRAAGFAAAPVSCSSPSKSNCGRRWYGPRARCQRN